MHLPRHVLVLTNGTVRREVSHNIRRDTHHDTVAHYVRLHAIASAISRMPAAPIVI